MTGSKKARCSPAVTIPAVVLIVLLTTVLLVSVMVSSAAIDQDDAMSEGNSDRPLPDQDEQQWDDAPWPLATTERDLSATFSKARRSHDEVTPHDEAQQEEWGLLAKENVLQMRSDSIRCATPRPRVIKVQETHPHAFKRFVPSCVVLHRCEREAGCCDDEDHVCSPIKKQRVYMYFYVVVLGANNGVASVGVHGQVERLRFTNHTECGCRRRRPPSTPKSREVMSDGVSIYHQGAWLVPALLLTLVTTVAQVMTRTYN